MTTTTRESYEDRLEQIAFAAVDKRLSYTTPHDDAWSYSLYKFQFLSREASTPRRRYLFSCALRRLKQLAWLETCVCEALDDELDLADFWKWETVLQEAIELYVYAQTPEERFGGLYAIRYLGRPWPKKPDSP